MNKRLLLVLLGLAVVAGIVVTISLLSRVEVTIDMDWTLGDPCPDALLVGAAGSGQSDNGPDAGPQVDSIVTAFGEQLAEQATTSVGVGYMVLDYPATGLLEGTLFSFMGDSMFDSIDKGRDSLLSVVAGTAERCPGTHIYLAGYSQGASVLHTAISEMPAAHHDSIAAVVVLSDPNRDADDPHTRHYAPEPEQAPIESATPHTRDGVFGALPTPTWLDGSFHSVCARMDTVCNFSLVDVLLADTVHTDETYHGFGPLLGRLLADDLLERM